MAGSGLTLIPSYTGDNDFPAYQDRLMVKSLGAQSGVLGLEDYKVSSGTGLQVNVQSGNVLLEQTKATEESSNEFYNGFYEVPNPIEQSPYNNVEIPSTNPQIAQIVVRVYDVEQLKIGGSSFGRIEWINGTPNANATEVKMKEGKFEGMAALPQSSYCLAQVLVPKNATSSSEYYIQDSRVTCNPSVLHLGGLSGGTLHVISGTYIEGFGTAITPLAKWGGIIEFHATGNLTLETIGRDKFFGDFISEATTIKLVKGQHVLIKSYGGTEWLISAGEPKRENIYTGRTKRTSGVAIEPSSTRPCQIVGYMFLESGKIGEIALGGESIMQLFSNSGSAKIPFSFYVPPGVKYTPTSEGTAEIYTSTMIM